MAQYTTLDEIVRYVLGDQEKYTTHEYIRLLNIANRGLKELTFDVLTKTKVVLLEVDSTLRVDLPDDFIDYVFVGVINSKYNLEPLGLNNKIPLSGSVNDDMKNDTAPAYWYGGLFGLGGGQNHNGYYSPTIDSDNNQMIFASTNVGQTIYLEYISDGSDVNHNPVIHPYAEEALASYVYWKSIQRKRNVAQSEKEYARRDYYNERRLARSRLCAFTKDELLQQIRKGFKQAPKI